VSAGDSKPEKIPEKHGECVKGECGLGQKHRGDGSKTVADEKDGEGEGKSDSGAGSQTELCWSETLICRPAYVKGTETISIDEAVISDVNRQIIIITRICIIFFCKNWPRPN
jgi:hypothetical protein